MDKTTKPQQEAEAITQFEVVTINVMPGTLPKSLEWKVYEFNKEIDNVQSEVLLESTKINRKFLAIREE